jgi:hypothetical protein
VSDPTVTDYLARLRSVESRLVAHAAAGPPPGLTNPVPGEDERWEAGQVWAHLAEFPAYWLNQIRSLLDRRAQGEKEPIPFGRTRFDPDRAAAIERDRDADPAALLVRVQTDVHDVADELEQLPEDAWTVTGEHPTIGTMALSAIVERFLVDHLEEHADQLDLLRSGGDTPSPDV